MDPPAQPATIHPLAVIWNELYPLGEFTPVITAYGLASPLASRSKIRILPPLLTINRLRFASTCACPGDSAVRSRVDRTPVSGPPSMRLGATSPLASRS